MSKLKVSGKVGEAVIYTVSDEKTAVDDYALAQIKLLCDNEVSRNSKVRVMPDVHSLKVSTVGLTMTVGERILPSLVGIDIGCGAFQNNPYVVAESYKEALKKFQGYFQEVVFAIYCSPKDTGRNYTAFNKILNG